MLTPDIIIKYIGLYTIDDFQKVNMFNNPRLFSFLNNQNVIRTLISSFDLNELKTSSDIWFVCEWVINNLGQTLACQHICNRTFALLHAS
mgnify:CR=1 FL=1